jgi:hypothetical protein
MGYYIRVLATDEMPIVEQELRNCLPRTPRCELDREGKGDSGWSQLVLRHSGGTAIAAIERNPVSPGELGEEEVAEFIEEARIAKPRSAARWLEQFLPRVKVIYAFQILSGTGVGDGWAAVHALQSYIWNKRGGILQADGEGFSNEDGYTIVWQFADDVDGMWKMAVLNEVGQWVSFEMDLANPEQRADFLEGILPQGVKILG